MTSVCVYEKTCPMCSDPLTVGVVGLTLLAVAVAASWVPAWRATRVDPMRALNAE